ncbi:MAG: flagellar hook-basal body complex protein FliE [Epsilonproteobacteria bacterium]|nr:flagellar hook-basal body complex protein FliE [Campylobacterota bacterium]
MAINGINKNIGEIFSKDLNKQTTNNTTGDVNFADMLKNELDNTNKIMQEGQEANLEIATGTVKDLAKATIAIEKADLKMQMMLEVRNKALNAYKELSKTQM